MINYFVAYIVTAIVFFAIDFVWLNMVAKNFYTSQIGHIMADPFNIPAAVVFYLIYVIGIVFFAVAPAMQGGHANLAIILGALFGFFCYATYDMTNLATLRDWPYLVTVVDIAWGTFLTAVSAWGGYQITKLIMF